MPDLVLLWGGWIGICVLAAAIALSLAALLHMFGVAFGLQSLVLYAKSEYMQVLATALIIVGAVAMVNVGGNVLGSLAAQLAAASGNTGITNIPPDLRADPFVLAKEYILQVPIECMSTIYDFVLVRNYWLEGISSFGFNRGNVEGISPSYFLAGHVSFSKFAMQNMFYLSLFQYIQYFVLEFSQYTMLQIFLPLGLILRVLPITRGVGGLLTAFALGFGFVFPATYVLIIAMMPSNQYACTHIDTANDFSRQMFGAKFLGDDPCFNNAGARGMAIYQSKANSDKDIDTAALMHAVKQLYLQVVFYPMISLIITFTFVRQTGSLFGADLAEIGRGLIKII
ncbi:MAG: hypothetical protein N3F07_03245, partial [Candidatus Micrarchaeota archaeon]|nr:hypothetical protein [Candidatus Micrarchaeota archaeon]